MPAKVQLALKCGVLAHRLLVIYIALVSTYATAFFVLAGTLDDAFGAQESPIAVFWLMSLSLIAVAPLCFKFGLADDPALKDAVRPLRDTQQVSSTTQSTATELDSHSRSPLRRRCAAGRSPTRSESAPGPSWHLSARSAPHTSSCTPA